MRLWTSVLGPLPSLSSFKIHLTLSAVWVVSFITLLPVTKRACVAMYPSSFCLVDGAVRDFPHMSRTRDPIK